MNAKIDRFVLVVPNILFISMGAISTLAVMGCGSSAPSSGLDTTGNLTESAVATVGGAVTSTAGNTISLNEGTNQKRSFFSELRNFVIPILPAYAFVFCPTTTTKGNTCSVSGQSMTLQFPTEGCVYLGSGGIWTGGTVLTTGVGNSSPACGNYPFINGSTITSVTRTFLGNILVNPTSRTTRNGAETVVLDSSPPSNPTFANVNATNPTSGTGGWQYNINAGGGYNRTFVSKGSHSISFTLRIVGYSGSTPAGKADYDHTVSTVNPLGTDTPIYALEPGNDSNATHIVSGTVILQHNLAKYSASALFNNVTSVNGCCFPNGGTVTTTYTGGANDGKSENFVFNAATCQLGTLGQVQFTDVTGAISTKTLTRCF